MSLHLKRMPPKAKAPQVKKITRRVEPEAHVCECSQAFTTTARLKAHRASCAAVKPQEGGDKKEHEPAEKEKKRHRVPVGDDLWMPEEVVDVDTLAVYKTGRAITDVIGTPKYPRLHHRLRAVMSGGMFGGHPDVRKGVAEAVGRLSQGSRRLLQQAVESGEGEAFHEDDPLKASLLYDALVPVASAYLEAEARVYGVSLVAGKIERMGRNPEMFQYVSVLSQACGRIHNNLPVEVQRQATMDERQATMGKRREVECYNCKRVGHKARQCTEPRKCRQCGQVGHIAKDCKESK